MSDDDSDDDATQEYPAHMDYDGPTGEAKTQEAIYDSDDEDESPSDGEDEQEDGVKDAGQVASLLLTTHGEIHLDEAREPKEFRLTYEDGLDKLVFISAVSVDSDAVNFGVCQVQERGIQELARSYVTNNWKPSMEQIIGPFRRVRNLDQYGRLQPPRKKARMGQYTNTRERMPASVRHRGAYETALDGADAGEYDPTRYVIQSRAGKGWRGIVLRPGKGSVKFLDKTYLIGKEESGNPKLPADNNALLFLPTGAPILQMISNSKTQQEGFYDGLKDDPKPGSLRQEIEIPGVPPVKLDRAAIGKKECGNMIDGKAAAGSSKAFPGLAAVVDDKFPGNTEVSTTLKCLVENSVKAYRRSLNKKEDDENVRLGSLVVLDLTCMVFKEEDGTFMDEDYGKDTQTARVKRATRREAEKIVRDLFEQEGAHLAPSLTQLEADLSEHKLKRKRPGGGRRTRRRRKVSKKRKARTGRKTRRGGKVRGQREMRGQRKTRRHKKDRTQRKTRRRR